LEGSRFFLFGDGEMRDDLERELELRGLEDAVTLMGWNEAPEHILPAWSSLCLLLCNYIAYFTDVKNNALPLH